MRHFALAPFLALAVALPVAAQAPGGPTLELARLQKGAKSRRVSSYDVTGGNNDRIENLGPGARRDLFNVKGAGVINHIWVTIAPPPPALSRHDIILRMYWDGETEPSVEAPIGDFFGQGWDESYPFSALPLAAGPREGRALVSYFPMPFASGARIEVENDSEQKIEAFYYYVDDVELQSLPPDLGRFHAILQPRPHRGLARGRERMVSARAAGQEHDGGAQPPDRRHRREGALRGRQLLRRLPEPDVVRRGDHVLPSTASVGPPRSTARAPRTTSTPPGRRTCSSSTPTSVTRASTPVLRPWLGRTHVYRFHLSDPVYFDRSLRFSIEHGHDNNLTLDLSTVAYWYQAEPHKKFPAFPSREARKPKPRIGEVDMHLWRDAWRKARGANSQLWGNEKEKKKE